MSEKELEMQIAALKQQKKQVCASRETALDFLVKAGICTKSGKLTKVYR